MAAEKLLTLLGLHGEDPANFVKQLSTEFNPITIRAYLDRIYATIPHLTKAIYNSMAPTNLSGSYGFFFKCKTDGSSCFKIIKVATHEQKYKVLKELFIQIFLYNDVLFKHRIPRIYGIYKAGFNEVDHIVVQMDLAQMDMEEYIKSLPDKILTFDIFTKMTEQAFRALQSMNIRYKFVHRDLKLNNLVLKQYKFGPPPSLDNSYIQFIDFGFSCITVMVGMKEYLITGGSYATGVPCREQQDVILYLYEILRRRQLDERTRIFIERFLAPDMKGRLNARAVGKKDAFHAAYNLNGTLFNETINLSRFTIANLLDALSTEVVVGAGPAGAGPAAAPAAAGAGGGTALRGPLGRIHRELYGPIAGPVRGLHFDPVSRPMRAPPAGPQYAISMLSTPPAGRMRASPAGPIRAPPAGPQPPYRAIKSPSPEGVQPAAAAAADLPPANVGINIFENMAPLEEVKGPTDGGRRRTRRTRRRQKKLKK